MVNSYKQQCLVSTQYWLKTAIQANEPRITTSGRSYWL